MPRAWYLVFIMLVGCSTVVYRGSDLHKVVLNEHSALIEQQMTLLKNGQVPEAIDALGQRARDPVRFEKLRDNAQAMLEALLKVGGPFKSYEIVEAEKIKDDASSDFKTSSDGGANRKAVSEMHDGVAVRVNVQFEHATAEFEYAFFLIDGIWKSAGMRMNFHAASE